MDPVVPVQEDIRRVGRRELYTDFGKRMEYMKTYLDFTEDDVHIFNKGAKYLKAAIPDLTHRLYQKMLEFDITARALRTRSTASEVQIEDLFTIDSPHVQRRKIFWKWYLTRLCSDPGQIEYWEYLGKIGSMHTGKVLMHPLRIEYVHMNVCLGYVKGLLLDTITNHPDMSVKFKFALLKTLSKIFCMQNDLISKCYINEGQEYTEESSNASNADSASTMETASNTDNASITNSEISSLAQDKPSYPRCLVPGFSNSRPNSAGAQSPTSRDRSGSVDLDRVSSTAETAVSSDCPSTSSSHRVTPSVVSISQPPAFASPFAVGHIHNFETKIWSSGLKRKGTGYK